LWEWQLAEIWKEVLKVQQIGINDDFFELGGHSLLALRMMHQVEDLCGRRLPLEVLFEEATVNRLAERLRTESRNEIQSAIVPIQPRGSRPPFFFLHGDWWGGVYCRKLARLLGPDQPFYGMMPNGFEGGPMPPTVEAMAEQNLQRLVEFQPQGPYLLGGYCGGGHVAYETARQMAEKGLEVRGVIIVDAWVLRQFECLRTVVRCAGRLARRGDPTEARLYERLRRYPMRFLRNYHRGIPALLGALLRVARRDLLQCLGIPRQASLAARTIDTLGGDKPDAQRLTAIVNYRPKPYAGRVALLASEWMKLNYLAEGTAGWGRLAPQTEVFEVPGNHTSCLTTHIATLAECMGKCLATFAEEVSKGEGTKPAEEPARGIA
jgi:thioesterase domain-containing protein/acyl carrier protein